MRAPPDRIARLRLHVPPEPAELIARAARLRGMSPEAFVLEAALRAAADPTRRPPASIA